MPGASPVAGVQLTTRSLQSRAAGAARPLAPPDNGARQGTLAGSTRSPGRSKAFKSLLAPGGHPCSTPPFPAVLSGSQSWARIPVPGGAGDQGRGRSGDGERERDGERAGSGEETGTEMVWGQGRRERGGEGTGTTGGVGGDTRRRESPAASPVRGPVPPASGSSSSARAASPGMTWPYARPSVPCLSVSPSRGACAATAPRPGGEGGQWMTSAPPRPPSAPSERARARQALRCAGNGGGGTASFPPHTPPRLHSPPAVRGPAFPAASPLRPH